MNINSLSHFLKCQYQLYEIPIRVYRNGKLVLKFDNGTIDALEESRDDTVVEFLNKNKDKQVFFNIQQQVLLEGAVFNKKDNYVIYVGLARAIKFTEEIMNRYFRDMKIVDLTPDDIKKLRMYINGLPLVSVGIFVVLLSAINTYVNDEVVEVKEIFENSIEEYIDETINNELLKKREERFFGRENNPNSIDTENRFLFYVKNGMVNEIKDFCKSLEGFASAGSAANPDAWRMSKNRVIVAIAIVSRTAISAGLSSIDMLHLADFYIHKTELCLTAKSLNEVKYNMLLDFTERVANKDSQQSDKYVVRAVCNYISENIENNFTLEELSEKFHINRIYLCKIFKAEMGMGLADYWQLQKINKAKELLLYTDKSLQEIAIYLNFCSQSYLGLIFKKFVGETPREFRNRGGGVN